MVTVGAVVSEDDTEAGEANVCCANCGIAEVDEIKLLEDCTDCDLVKYCSDKCRQDHREEHEEECKKRKEELYVKELFSQPEETHLGECPICFLPMPLDRTKSTFMSCCSKVICDGCKYADIMNNIQDIFKGSSCPFCREQSSWRKDEEKIIKQMMKRVKANDPVAMNYMGSRCYHEGNYDDAFEYWTKAAELGDTCAHYEIGVMYMDGEGVEKDAKKTVYHLEKAAIGGHHLARFNLGCIAGEMGHNETAVQHLIIAAKLGHEESMKGLWKHYSVGNITKEDLDATLRANQAAIDAAKSEQRDAAESFQRNLRNKK